MDFPEIPPARVSRLTLRVIQAGSVAVVLAQLTQATDEDARERPERD
jgi:hypothetical protein